MVEVMLSRELLYIAPAGFLFGVACARLLALRRGQTFEARSTWAVESIAFILAALFIVVCYSVFARP